MADFPMNFNSVYESFPMNRLVLCLQFGAKHYLTDFPMDF